MLFFFILFTPVVCTSRKTNDVEHLCICLWPVYMSSFTKCLLNDWPIFQIGFSVFFLNCKNSLYFVDPSPWLDTRITRIFPRVQIFFISLMEPFKEQKFFILMNSNLFCFSFIAHAFCVLLPTPSLQRFSYYVFFWKFHSFSFYV